LITQEVDQLKSLVKLCDERIQLLKELKSTVNSGENLSLPSSHARMLQEKLPLMSEIAADTDKVPTGSADDYLISKTIIPQDAPVTMIKFLPLRNPRSGGGSSSSSANTQTSMPSVLLAAAQEDGTVRLFSPHGDLVLTFSSGHEEPLTHLAVSLSQDEYSILTADVGGILRLHKISVRQRRLTKEQRSARRNNSDEKVSQYLGLQVNVTAQFQKQMQVPPSSDGKPPKLTTLAMTSQQGSKYHVVGDEAGRVGVFIKNGSYSFGIDTAGEKIEGLYPHLSNLIYRTRSEWGYVDLQKKNLSRVDCPGFVGPAVAVAFDSQQAARVLVSDIHGTVWVLNLKERKNCKVEHQYPRGATKAPIELSSIKGFAIGLEHAGRSGDAASIVAINMSHVGKNQQSLPSAVAWRKQRSPVKDWSLHKRYQAGDLLAFLSEDGSEIEIMELLMSVYQAPAQDSFGNFKMPVIAVAVVLVLGYQYMKQKGGKGGKGKFDGMDFGGLGKSKGLGSLGKLAAGRRGGGLGGGLGRGLGRR
jgi:hypothetical protein